MKITEFKKKPTLADVLRVGQAFCQSDVEKAVVDKFLHDGRDVIQFPIR